MFERVRDAPFEWMGPPDASFLEISDWGLDEFATREATAILSPRFSVKPVTFEEADFDTWTPESLVSHLREMPPPEDPIDAYVLILRDWQSDAIGRSIHQVAGIGLYDRQASGGQRLGVFASCRIVVIDAHSFEVLASRLAQMPDGTLPWLPVAPSLWPATQNDLTDAEKAALQENGRRLLGEAIGPALRGMISGE